MWRRSVSMPRQRTMNGGGVGDRERQPERKKEEKC